jgi:hypothetical protein
MLGFALERQKTKSAVAWRSNGKPEKTKKKKKPKAPATGWSLSVEQASGNYF